jgi:tryptophan halogenase
MKIKTVTIVGGGSAGWMTAAGLIAQMPNLEITLVESDDIGTIGVGESTLAAFNIFLDALGLEDSEWMPHCNATYKSSIKFTDFRERLEKPVSFHYPFGSLILDNKDFGLMEWYLAKGMNPEIECSTFAEYYHENVWMTNANKMTDNKFNELKNFNFKYDTAYHFDAALFGRYLREHYCKPRGVKHVVDDVVDIPLCEDGSVDYILTKNGSKLKSDLYIDCTGFKAMLIEETMGSEFISFSDTLMNDSAIATHIPYIDKEREMESVTNCTAIDSGWVWNIPVWNRIGTGYVYSSKFATKEQAEEQFRKHLASDRMVCQDKERADSAVFKHIKIRHGVHKQSWIKNVVAVGLSNGFIEPLESTGLLTTHNSILRLIDTFQMKNCTMNQFDIDVYNSRSLKEILGYKDFVSMHYALSSRNDTEYWRHVTENMHYSKVLMGLDQTLDDGYSEFAKQIGDREFQIELAGLLYISAGMGYVPAGRRFIEFAGRTYPDMNKSYEIYKKRIDVHKVLMERKIAKMSSHYEFLKKTIYVNELDTE